MRLNVVLDLDLTLICTHPAVDDDEDNEKREDPKKKYDKLQLHLPKNIKLRNKVYSIKMKNPEGECKGTEDIMYGVYRPYLYEFLDFLEKNCNNIIIWTAGIIK
jgi:hypothetical protein